ESSVGVESTVLDLSKPAKPVILRPGAIDAKQLARVLRRPVATLKSATKKRAALRAPGLLEKHYSPRTPLRLMNRVTKVSPKQAVILLRKPAGTTPAGTYWL